MLTAAARESEDRPGTRGPVGRLLALAAAGRDALNLVVRELMKFGVVGAVAFVVDVGLFNLLLHTGSQPVLEGRPVTAGVVSVSVAIVVAWLGNRYWTFRHRRRGAVRREAVLFVLMNLVGMAIALGCLAFSRYVLGLSSPLADNVAKNGVGLVLGMTFRFLAYRYVVFRGDLEARRSAADTPPDPPHEQIVVLPPDTVSVRDASDAAEPDGPRPPARERGPQRTWTTSPALSDTRP